MIGMIGKGCLALVWLLAVPAGCGLLVTARRKHNCGAGMTLLLGYAALFSLAEVLFLTGTFAKLPLHLLVWIYGGSTAALSLFGAALFFRNRKKQPKKQRERLSAEFWLAVGLIALQTLLAVLFTHLDADDAFYVGTAATAVETDSVFCFNPYTGMPYTKLPSRYVLSPFPIWLAAVSRLCLKMHPAVLAHTVLPAVFLPLAYAVYHSLGVYFFPKNRRAQGVFLLFAAVIQMSSYFSVYTQGTFLLVRIWQGKAFLASILLPALLLVCLSLFREADSPYRRTDFALLLCACCLVSSMGILLAPVLLAVFLLLCPLRKRQWRLLGKCLLCCLPNLLLGLVYVWIK